MLALSNLILVGHGAYPYFVIGYRACAKRDCIGGGVGTDRGAKNIGMLGATLDGVGSCLPQMERRFIPADARIANIVGMASSNIRPGSAHKR